MQSSLLIICFQTPRTLISGGPTSLSAVQVHLNIALSCIGVDGLWIPSISLRKTVVSCRYIISVGTTNHYIQHIAVYRQQYILLCQTVTVHSSTERLFIWRIHTEVELSHSANTLRYREIDLVLTPDLVCSALWPFISPHQVKCPVLLRFRASCWYYYCI